MSKRNPETLARQARNRIGAIREELATIDYLCSGTLLKRMMKCGKPSCRCHEDPAARHGPYYEWTHMKAGKLIHRYVWAEQARLLEQAIANYRKAQKLLRAWEVQTERLIEAEAPREGSARWQQQYANRGPTPYGARDNGDNTATPVLLDRGRGALRLGSLGAGDASVTRCRISQ